MSVIKTVHQIMHDTNVVWQLENGEHIFPTEEDVQKVLDKAIAALYDGAQQIEVAGMMVQRTPSGYDVYVMAGHIEGE